MTNEGLNTALYKKVFAEQEKYREWLLSQPPNEILNHCYEYTVREDIVLALEYYQPKEPLGNSNEKGHRKRDRAVFLE